jgi:hypothetical protein
MGTGKAVNLRVRPVTSVDLCYPVDGLISWQIPNLYGTQVRHVMFGHLYSMLSHTASQRPPEEGEVGGDSRLVWGSDKIDSYLRNVAGQAAGPGTTLVSRLRNVSEAADLDSALAMRQNAFLTSYSPEVLEVARKAYHSNPGDQSAVRHRLLAEAEKDVRRLHRGLDDAYRRSGWSGIIEYARSEYDNKATQYSGSGHVQFEGIADTLSWGYEYRYPSAENDLRYRNVLAAVRQEYVSAWRMSELHRHGATVFANELRAIDQSIRKLQSAYIDTFLVTPTPGVVTGVFREQGDYVRAGEPVVRVENDAAVILVGTVKYRGMVRVGDGVTVSTALAGGAAPTTLIGEVIAVRGHDAVSEQWELLALCDNLTPTDDRILPLNYNFDFERTTVDFT